MVDKCVLDKLREYDSATIANVIELFQVRRRNRGFMTREIKAAFPQLPPMVGFAATATCRTVSPDCPTARYQQCQISSAASTSLPDRQ